MPETFINPADFITEADLHSRYLSAQVHELLGSQATTHTSGNELFAPLGWDPRNPLDRGSSGNPGQILADFRIEADQTPDLEPTIRALGETYFTGFNKLADQFSADTELLDSILEKTASKENVVVVTNHGNISDIAVVEATLRVALSERAAETHQKPLGAEQYSLIVHRMIAQLGVTTPGKPDEITPALRVLQLVGETFLSFPRTESSRKNKVPPELDRHCTDHMLAALQDKLSYGGQILAFAPSGSQDESLIDRVGRTIRKIIKPVNSGTYRLMQGENTWVLGVSVDLDGEDGPNCSYNELSQCESDEDCVQLLESIAEKHTVMTGIKTIFARSHDDLERLRAEFEQRRSQPRPIPVPIEEIPSAQSLHRAERTAAGLVAAGVVAGWLIGRYSRKP